MTANEGPTPVATGVGPTEDATAKSHFEVESSAGGRQPGVGR